jgi:transposase
MARELGVDRKTVRRLLAHARPTRDQRTVPRPSLVTPYLHSIQHRVPEVDYHAYRIFQELKAQGDTGGSEMVKRAVRPWRVERERRREATVRVETPPGHQAQVDWGSGGVWRGGERRRVHVLVMVLGYARALDAECTEAERLPTWLGCHEHAFDWFGGVPEELLYEHPKTVVLARDLAGRQITWNPQCWDVAQDSGVQPRLWWALSGPDERAGGVRCHVRQARLPAGADVYVVGRPERPRAGLDSDRGRPAGPWPHRPQAC